MRKLTRIGGNLNAFKFQFDDQLLDEIRNSYQLKLHDFISDPNNQIVFGGGRQYRQPVKQSSNEYYLISYGTSPLLWFSCNSFETYNIYKRFFNALDIANEVKELVDYDEKIIMYCGSLVIGDRAFDATWHIDYHTGANAYTLITPLFELDGNHGNLLYEASDDQIATYQYTLNEAIIFGDKFKHSTEPYPRSKHKRIMLSCAFGTDKLQYWDILKNTISDQSDFLILPCGHRYGACKCAGAAKPDAPKPGRNGPCHCGSGKKYKYCHGRLS